MSKEIKLGSLKDALCYWPTVLPAPTDVVRDAAAKAGFDDLIPDAPPASQTLKEVAEDVTKELFGNCQNELVRVTACERDRTWEVNRQMRGWTTNKFKPLYSVTCDEKGEGIELHTASGYITDPGCNHEVVHRHKVGRAIEQKMVSRMTILPRTTITKTLIKAMSRWNAQSLQPRGGLYFLGSDYVEKYHTFAEAMPNGNVFIAAPIVPQDIPGFTTHLMDKLQEELTDFTAQTLQQLEDLSASGKELRSDSVQTRKRAIEQKLQKLNEYEQKTGQKLDDHRKMLAQVQGLLDAQRMMEVSAA